MDVGLLLEIDPAVVTHFLHLESRKLRGAPKAMTARTFNNKRYFGMVIADKSLSLVGRWTNASTSRRTNDCGGTGLESDGIFKVV